LNDYTDLKANYFNILINKKILKENYDETETYEKYKPESFKLVNFKVESRIDNNSPCGSFVNLNRNRNNINKQFKYNNNVYHLGADFNFEIKNESINDFSNQQGIFFNISIKIIFHI